MRLSILVLIFLLVGCSTRHPVEEAKAVLKSHEQFSKAGDLDGIMSNIAEDVVCFFPGTPIIKGKEACRNFYAAVLKASKSEFIHEYDGAEIVGDAVILHGTARGTTTMPDSSVTHFVSNFLTVLRYQPDGKLKLWRGTSVPSAQ